MIGVIADVPFNERKRLLCWMIYLSRLAEAVAISIKNIRFVLSASPMPAGFVSIDRDFSCT